MFRALNVMKGPCLLRNIITEYCNKKAILLRDVVVDLKD